MMRALFALLVVLASLPAVAFDYVIDRFHADMTLHRDGTMDVVERIEVQFNIPRRGIFRFIPVDLPTGRGTARRMSLTNIEVTDERGDRQTTKVSREGPNVRIRIGDEDIVFPAGKRKTYVIRYTTFGMMNWQDEDESWARSAELYWNVTGNEWDTTIGKTSFKLKFPAQKNEQDVRAVVFAGSYGSTEQHLAPTAQGMTRNNQTETMLTLGLAELEVARDVPLMPGEGITFALSLPDKAIDKPSPWQQFKLFILPNIGFGIPLVALLAMPFLWFRHGKDPAGGPMVVQFEPPDGISGSEAGTLLDEKVDQRDIAAGIISLAVKGYLKIHVDEEGLIFKKRVATIEMLEKTAGPELTLFEAELHRKLKAAGPMVTDSDLRSDVAPHLSTLQKKLYEAMVHRGYYITDPQTARTMWVIGGAFAMVVLGLAALWISPLHDPLPSIVGGVIGFVVILLYSGLMPRRTKVGALAHKRVQGFEEFIRRARRNEMEWMSQKHPDQAMFEEFLPHAVAFGLTREWARAFEGILHEMPSWYVTPHPTGFHYGWFASDLVTVSNSLGAAASTPPRSSGASGGGSGFSSGGGFSGGGFGGGGGGSW